MSDRSLTRLVVLVATSLVAVIAVGSVLGSRAVGADLSDRTERALAAAGLDDVVVGFSGREAELSGGNDVESRRATELVEALPGVRQVTVESDDAPVVPGVSRFELDRSGDDVEISGAVPTPDDAAAIKVGVATALRTTVTGDVAVSPSVEPADWVADLPAVFSMLARVDRLELEIPGDGTVHVGGEVADASLRSRVVDQVAETLDGLEIVDSIRVAAPRTAD